jgi:carboxy-cis,cis-muconate cyclase
MPTFHFVVGSFNTSEIYTFAFNVSRDFKPNLHVIHRSNAQAPHSWLHVSDNKKVLYATSWTEPPGLAAYAINALNDIKLINSVRTASRSGYVCASDRAVYSAGGASGEVFAIDQSTGGFLASSQQESDYNPLQKLSFIEDQPQQDDGSVMDFGGLRHGSHSADLSPDGKALYVADIGRNAIFTFSVDPKDGKLTLGEKHISPRSHDGPRHVWPHPAGKHVYCLQEHSSMVDVFEIVAPGPKLKHVQGVKIIPEAADCKEFWADEVRTSLSDGAKPKYLYASTRGLEKTRMGYVAAFRLLEDGRIDDGRKTGREHDGLLAMWETPTSGGWANAIQPGPTVDGIEYIALTDSEEGLVMVLSWDGREFKEAARAKLDGDVGAATAVWL